MTQSLSKILLRLVFSTKKRAPVLDDIFREALHSYIAGILLNLASPAVTIGSVEDHIHLLLQSSKNIGVSKIVEEVKKSSSKWLKGVDGCSHEFRWQTGYAVFSVSSSDVGVVKRYIENQRKHHAKFTFAEELELLLSKHDIVYNKNYLYDE
jgi:putative transposase